MERRKPKNVPCPHCGHGRTKVLFSEMGGYQTRQCSKCGSQFHYDKWIADRAFWRGVL